MKLSEPEKFGSGSYVQVSALPDRLPLAGSVTISNVRISAVSTSVPVRVISSGVSSAVLSDCGSATGGSLTGVTVIETVAGLLS